MQELNGGLIALSACLHGEVAQRLINDDPKGAEAAAREYAELFPGRFYLEVQANELPEQLKVNEALLRTGAPLGDAPGGHQRRALPQARTRQGPGCPALHPDGQDGEQRRAA